LTGLRRRSAGESLLFLAAAGAASICLAQGALAGDEWQSITVSIDQAKLLDLPRGADRIVLGNPFVVGMTRVPNAAAVVLTGKAFGETNMIVLDARGSIVVNATIRVALPASTDLIVQRGDQRSTYDCAAKCGLRMQLGDGGEVSQGVAAEITTRNGLAGADKPTPPNPKAGGAL
jgi:hypothetical protein